jgi:hypothetical protein
MFKEFMQGLSKFFTKQRMFVIVIFIVLAIALVVYSGEKSVVIDRMTDGSPYGAVKSDEHKPDASPVVNEPSLINNYNKVSVANPSDLLPNDQNSQWAALNPVGSSNNAMLPDLLQAGYHIGLDTIGQTLRNPNYQLRSDPIIPVQQVGPWNQSTIEPDYGRVPLEINP